MEMHEQNKKITDKSVDIVTDFMMNKFTFGEAMATLSIALIKIAESEGVDKKTFVENMSKDWDKLSNNKNLH
jgi:hypothetical protein